MRFFYKPTYLNMFGRLTSDQQTLALKADSLIKDYLRTSKAPFGLRIKQLQKDIFEARVSDRLRIIWVRDRDEITFAILGNHEEVKRFLKRF